MVVKIDGLLGQLCGRWGSSASLPIQFKRRCVDAFATSTYLKPQCFKGKERREEKIRSGREGRKNGREKRTVERGEKREGKGEEQRE